jgi:hypothetical protein
MAQKRFLLEARVSTENPRAVEPKLRRLLPGGTCTPTADPKEFRVTGELEGTSARDLNRAFLSALREVEKRTRLRAEWTCEGTTERFFDYVPKGKRSSAVSPSAPA